MAHGTGCSDLSPDGRIINKMVEAESFIERRTSSEVADTAEASERSMSVYLPGRSMYNTGRAATFLSTYVMVSWVIKISSWSTLTSREAKLQIALA